ncbi:MAG: hypothetical protein ACYC9D_00585 [Candidatus Dormibacteria bacterium]
MRSTERSGFLFATPTFWQGIARILDLGGVLNTYNTCDSDQEADRVALASDWYAIGLDFREAFGSEVEVSRRALAKQESLPLGI